MFLFRSDPPPDPKTLTTPTPRIASEQVSPAVQDIAALDELTQLGMQLARLIVRAATKLHEAEPEPEPAKADPAAPPRPKTPDYGLAFARVSRAIQTGITLKTRLTNGQIPPEEAIAIPTPPETANDPRRPAIAAYLHELADAVPHHPNRRLLHQTLEARIDKGLAADPSFTLAGGDIVIPICKGLGLTYDLAKMHDDLIYPVGYVRKRRFRPLDDEAGDPDKDPEIPAHGPGPP
jgi:hypothetical protein